MALSEQPFNRIAGQTARLLRATWIVWAVFCLAASAFIVVDTGRSPVNTAYAKGAERWQGGDDLYDGGGTGFIYLPHSAILHVPLIQLPRPLKELAWRIVTIGLFSAGIFRLSRLVVAWSDRSCEAFGSADSDGAPATIPEGSIVDPQSAILSDPATQRPSHLSPGSIVDPGSAILSGSFFLLITLLTLPKTWTVAVNGQATPAMAGLMLLAVVDLAGRRWWRATACLILALAFKPLAIVLLLLAAALYAPMRWRLAAGIAVFVALPYVGRDPQYVSTQYAAFVGNLHDSARLGLTSEWPQLFSLLHWLGLEISSLLQTTLRVMAALLTLIAGWRVCRRCPPAEAAVLLYSLAGCYLLLFNPRTENNSYTLLMPAVAVYAARAMLIDHDWRRSVFLIALTFLLTTGYGLNRLLTPDAPIVWTCPLACLVFLGFVVRQIAGADRHDFESPRELSLVPGRAILSHSQ